MVINLSINNFQILKQFLVSIKMIPVFLFDSKIVRERFEKVNDMDHFRAIDHVVFPLQSDLKS